MLWDWGAEWVVSLLIHRAIPIYPLPGADTLPHILVVRRFGLPADAPSSTPGFSTPRAYFDPGIGTGVS